MIAVKDMAGLADLYAVGWLEQSRRIWVLRRPIVARLSEMGMGAEVLHLPHHGGD